MQRGQLENHDGRWQPRDGFQRWSASERGHRLSLLRAHHQQCEHPRALLDCDALDGENKSLADQCMRGHSRPKEFYINKTAGCVAALAASAFPKRTIVEQYEPDEENLMKDWLPRPAATRNSSSRRDLPWSGEL